jgi:RHS repeat-associated protein
MNATASPSASVSDQALDRLLNYWTIEEQQRQVDQKDDRIVGVTEIEGMTCEYRYDTLGQLTQILEPEEQMTRYEYDPQSRLQRVIHPDGAATDYHYSSSDRLTEICDRGLSHHFIHNDQGRLIQVQKGNAGSVVYRYDAFGNVAEARTSQVSSTYHYGDRGQVTRLSQMINGVELAIEWIYDEQNRLVQMCLPQIQKTIHYDWDEQNWLAQVSWGDRSLAQFQYDRTYKTTQIYYANGITETVCADAVDSRPLSRRLTQDTAELLWEQHRSYFPSGQLQSDGERIYEYDRLGRLIQAENITKNLTQNLIDSWVYHYDDRDTMISSEIRTSLNCCSPSIDPELQFDQFGRLRYLTKSMKKRVYRYNDAHQLIQVLEDGNAIASLTYDAKGRLVLNQTITGTERYVYGSDDALVLATDEQGHPLRSYVWTPLGLLAEIWLTSGEIFYRHQDDVGTSRFVTDSAGKVCDRFCYSPFGQPIGENVFQPMFTGHFWHPQIKLYDCRARWYDSELARFLTPDTYTGAPDDERIVNPFTPASKQLFSRAEILATWLKYPRVRNRYTYCQNDPINRVDPNGHWSFGGVLLSVLGAIWTLPNTILGILIEITCLIGEVVRWLVWLISVGNVSWQTPGFDVASSGHLNAFALVFRGGWMVSAFGMLGITFGNVFFVSKEWDTYVNTLPAELEPEAYQGSVKIPREQSLYEHELRHTNQYGWFGPFFLFGLPIWGVYLWDAMINGYYNAWLERDARAHGGM